MKATNAQLNGPCGVFVSDNGEIYIADASNHRVRKVLLNGQIVTIAGTGEAGYNGDDQPATLAKLNFPTSVVVSSRNEVYIAEHSGNSIRKIDCEGMIHTIAGNGFDEDGFNGDDQLATQAQLGRPSGLFITDEEEVLFADGWNYRIRMIESNGMIKTIAGTGQYGYNGDDILATEAHLAEPSSVFKYKNEIYVTDTSNQRIRKILQNGKIVTIAGSGSFGFNGDDQVATLTHLYQPNGLHVHNDNVYFSDEYNQRIRVIDSNGKIKTISGTERSGYNGDGILATEAQLSFPSGIFVSNSGHVYIADIFNHRIRMIDPHSGLISTIAGTGYAGYSGDVPFDFHKYPHIGPTKPFQPFSKRKEGPFVSAYHDMDIKFL